MASTRIQTHHHPASAWAWPPQVSLSPLFHQIWSSKYRGTFSVETLGAFKLDLLNLVLLEFRLAKYRCILIRFRHSQWLTKRESYRQVCRQSKFPVITFYITSHLKSLLQIFVLPTYGTSQYSILCLFYATGRQHFIRHHHSNRWNDMIIYTSLTLERK